MKLRSIYFICAVFLFTCSHPAKKIAFNSNIKSKKVNHGTFAQKANDTLAIPDDTIPKVTIPEGAIEVGEIEMDSTSKVRLLDQSDYNAQDDVGPKDAKLEWQGIFYNKNNYYIRPTKIKFIKEHSEMDEEGKETGWRLKVIGKDTCMKLISGADLTVGVIEPVKLNFIYYAGQKQEFDYDGVRYTLYTTGTKRDGQIQNCKLYLMANVKGHIFNQLLRSLGNDIILNGGGDSANSMDLQFVGDIDGDKIPDFIIGGSGYSFGEMFLYLSKSAGSEAIVKKVAGFFVSD